jgi:sodium-coupled monocarboxylate transporter 8/12
MSKFILDNYYTIPGMIGLFLGAVFCSSLSSLSSALNSAAAIVWADLMLLFPYFHSLSDKDSLKVNKLIVLLSGLLCAGFTYMLSFSSKNLIQLSVTLNGSFNAPLLGLFYLSMFFNCTNKTGVIAGMLSGMLATLWVSLGGLIVSPVYPRLPVSIESCFNQTLYPNITSLIITFTNLETNFTGWKKFYSMSFHLYTPFGAIVTILVGIAVSLLTGGRWQSKDKKLIIFDLLKFIAPSEEKQSAKRKARESELRKGNITF